MARLTDPMTPGDHALAMACVVASTMRYPEPGRVAMHAEILGRCVAKSTGMNPMVVALREAAECVLRCPDDIVAKLQLDKAIFAWAELRLGLALELEGAE